MSASTEKNQIAIRCQGLSKRFGELEALQALDLSIPVGAIFGFLGRNGAGKTTAIRLLTGLANPTAGTAWVNGYEITESNSLSRQQFGYLPQDPAFYNWMSPVEYLDHIARLFQIPEGERRQRIDEMIQLAGLEKAAKRRIGGFSGGMVQRLGIAQAMIHRPAVLFLDEPTSALDPAGRYDVLNMISQLRGQITVFLSTHILDDVERVCDTIGIIHEGKLLLVSDRDELLGRYAANVLAIQFDRSVEESLTKLAALFAQQVWAANVSQNGAELRVAVHDVDAAKRQAMALLATRQLPVDKYEWIRPSLEEIFLAISS